MSFFDIALCGVIIGGVLAVITETWIRWDNSWKTPPEWKQYRWRILSCQVLLGGVFLVIALITAIIFGALLLLVFICYRIDTRNKRPVPARKAAA